MNDEPQHKHRKYYILALFAVFIAILGVILPETEFTPKQYINASNITVVGAAATSGSLQNISEINYGYFNISEGNAQPFYAIVNFTNVTNFSFLEAKSIYFSTSGTPSSHVVDLEIYCTIDNQYEDLFFLENALEWRYFTRHFPDSTHFIDSQGNVSVKFNHSANGNTNHRLWIDTVRLITSVQYEQNIVTLNQYFNTTGGTGNGTGSQNLSQVLTIGNNAEGQKINNVSGLNTTGTIIYNPNNMSMGTYSNWVASTDSFYAITNHSNTIMNMHALTNDTGALEIQFTNFFGAYKSSYNTTTQALQGLPADTSIFNFFGKGWDGTSFGLSAVNIELKTGSNAWNSTSHPTKINFYTKSAGDVKAIRLTIDQDGGVTITSLAGVGNRPLCADPNGKVIICP